MKEDDALVFIIDDEAQVRDSLVNLCRSVDLKVRAFASTGEFLSTVRPSVACCIVLDVRFPGSAPSGLDFQRSMDGRSVPPIIFVTGHGDIEMSVDAMKLGAIEFLTKPVREQKLLDAIRRGLELDRRRLAEEERLLLLRRLFNSLTMREREIMHLVTQGHLNKQVAAAVGLSEVTVKAHRGRIMHKMGAHSLAELVRMSDLLTEPGKGGLLAPGDGGSRIRRSAQPKDASGPRRA